MLDNQPIYLSNIAGKIGLPACKSLVHLLYVAMRMLGNASNALPILMFIAATVCILGCAYCRECVEADQIRSYYISSSHTKLIR